MDARLQRRVQRYGWDLAAGSYEPLWKAQLASAQARLVRCARLAPRERVLDVACGTGIVTLAAARAVGPHGRVTGVDLSAAMVEGAGRRANDEALGQAGFVRMDAEALAFPDASFDVVLCAFGLMYIPDPEAALREMLRVLRPGGRLVVAVWGERQRCGWAGVFPIVDAEVASEVCPLFFLLGGQGALASACGQVGFEAITQHRFDASLDYSNGDEACDAAFVGGPAALAWSRFDATARERVRRRYLDSIAEWRDGEGFRVPGEFVVVAAMRR